MPNCQNRQTLSAVLDGRLIDELRLLSLHITSSLLLSIVCLSVYLTSLHLTSPSTPRPAGHFFLTAQAIKRRYAVRCVVVPCDFLQRSPVPESCYASVQHLRRHPPCLRFSNTHCFCRPRSSP